MSQGRPAHDKLVRFGFPPQPEPVSAARAAWHATRGDNGGRNQTFLIDGLFFQLADDPLVSFRQISERGIFRFRTILPEEDIRFLVSPIA